MFAHVRRYSVLVLKSWGRAISGPVLAIAGLVLLLAQQTVDGPQAANTLKMLGWGVLGTAALMVVVAQYQVWKSEREARIEAENRLKPRAIIGNLTPRVWPAGQGGVAVTGKEYYFDIFNSSEVESLDGVRVEVARMVPDAIGYPNPPLHVRNDDYVTREFSINPLAIRQIDLITGPVNAPNSQAVMIVAHTVNKYRTAIPNGKYEITVRVSASNSPPTTATFVALLDNTGELQCVMQQ
jgi:hypothetical protein